MPVPQNRLRSILFDAGGPAGALRYRQELIQRRLRFMAGLFALLILAWILLEQAVLTDAVLLRIAGLRIVLAASLVALAIATPRLPALAGIALLILLQALGFAAMRASLDAGAPAWLQLGYGLFPFVLAAQLALFPLPLLHGLLLALPAVALSILPLWRSHAAFLHSLPGDLWLLTLILILSLWAGGAQLALLLHLWSARWDAAHDPMTGLANRRNALAQLAADIARAQRSGAPLSLLLLDLDHFKHINDQYGHATGDTVIETLGKVLQDGARGGDLPARIGGEEFVVLLPDTDLDAARQVAERYRERIADTPASTDETKQVRFTCSFGVASLHPGDRSETLLARADAALYAAKAAGRNCVRAEGSER